MELSLFQLKQYSPTTVNNMYKMIHNYNTEHNSFDASNEENTNCTPQNFDLIIKLKKKMLF